MPTLSRQSVRNLGVRGLVRQASVDDFLIPDEAVTEAVNVHFDRIGAVQSRPGLTGIGSSVSSGNPCIGLHNEGSSSLISVFVATGSATIYQLQSGAWQQIGKGLGSGKLRFVDFAQRTIMFGGAERSMQVFSGSNFSTTSGDPINPDDMWYVNGTTAASEARIQYGEVYKSRIYLTGDTRYQPFGSRLWFSSVISSSGVITWSPQTDYVDINPSDGENFTALKRFSLELLCFKPNYIYRFRTSGVDPDPLVRVGTRSQESVIEGKRGLYFHHDSGFYRYSGGYPEEISRPISDIVKAITFGNYDDIAAWKDDDNIYWSIGNVTVSEAKQAVTYTSAVVRFTESSEVWTVYSYPTTINWGVPFVSGTSKSIAIGLNTGVVAQFNKGVADLGESIKFRMITKWYEWGGLENQKEILEMIAITEKGQGTSLMYQTDDYTDWVTMSPSLDKLITWYTKNTNKFHRIRFKLAGSGYNESMVFLGIEVPRGIMDYVKNS